MHVRTYVRYRIVSSNRLQVLQCVRALAPESLSKDPIRSEIYTFEIRPKRKRYENNEQIQSKNTIKANQAIPKVKMEMHTQFTPSVSSATDDILWSAGVSAVASAILVTYILIQSHRSALS